MIFEFDILTGETGLPSDFEWRMYSGTCRRHHDNDQSSSLSEFSRR
jgi:hypothetical protein